MCPKLDDARHRGFIFCSVSVLLTILEQIYKPKMAKDWTYFKAEFAARSQRPGCHASSNHFERIEKGRDTFVASSESGKFKVYQVHQVHLLNNVNPGLSEQLTSIFWKLESGHRQSGFWLGGDGIPRSGMCVLLFCGEGGGEEWSGRHNLDNTLL